jgi:hypothetical protein
MILSGCCCCCCCCCVSEEVDFKQFENLECFFEISESFGTDGFDEIIIRFNNSSSS